jgi:hypothetical protein
MATTDDTHECPAPGCKQRCDFDRFACNGHWRSLPSMLQSRLLRAWRDEPGSDPYFTVRAECLRALGIPDADVAEMNAGVA